MAYNHPMGPVTDAPHLFCFGFGYSARALARHRLAEGWRVTGTLRARADKTDKAERDAALSGVSLCVFESAHGVDEALLETASHVLISIPPVEEATEDEPDIVLARHRAALARSRRLQWLGYLSTTGVYGDAGGGWVDEHSPLRPSGARGCRRLAAEQAWLDLHRQSGVPVHIFRLAGIYGPARNALESVRAGTARRVVKPGQIFSRIHVADIVQVLCASMAQPNPGAVYNVCDDEPSPPQDVLLYAAQRLGLPPPPEVPFAQAALSPMARSFYDDNKRVRNERIKRELGVVLLYPDYRCGLDALLGS